MHRAVIAATIAGFVMSGCASAPAVAPGDFAWSYADSPGEGAKLAYGRPQSDEVLVMMTCAPNSQVMLSAAAMGGSRLILISGGAKTTLNGAVADGFDGQGYLEVSTPAKGAALAAFRKSGDLTLNSGGRSVDVKALDADRPAVSRFFQACEAA